MELYAQIAGLNREKTVPDAESLQAVNNGLAAYPEEWLLRYELLNTASTELRDRAHAELKELIGTNQGLPEENVA